MTHQITLNLDDEMWQFIQHQSQGKWQEYINSLLKTQRHLVLEAELAFAHQQDQQNPEYLAELALWDVIVADGMEDENANA